MLFKTIFLCLLSITTCLLYPQESETRDRRQLDGLWSFVREPANSPGWGIRNRWDQQNIALFSNSTRLPVPCSFNDLTEERALRDHVGWVWYQKRFHTPVGWANKDHKIVLRFGSVQYFAVVHVNGHHVMNHTGGHLPFEADVTAFLSSEENVVSVAVNNTMSHQTIPQGEFVYKNDTNRYPPGYFEQKTDFDFKNYAGIHRPVYLILLPHTHIADITVVTTFIGKGIGQLAYTIVPSGPLGGGSLGLELWDGERRVARADGVHGKLAVPNVVPWWPVGMGQRPIAKLYRLVVQLRGSGGGVDDVYRLDVGFRSVSVDATAIRINGRLFYCHGFGMHEDADIRGRGFDWAVMTKDLNALEWMGGNCFRTSHYPYAEERFQECDRRGIAIIAETPAVGLRVWTPANLRLHGEMLRELVGRDKNHPSVFAWSLANEPQSAQPKSRPYFKTLVDLAHKLDPTRPVTIVFSASYWADKAADLVDFACVNRYYGWYIDAGRPEVIQRSLDWDFRQWHKRLGKPLILSEYGAGSLPDVNAEPGVMFSDAYQGTVLIETHKALDALRKDPTFPLSGEMVWNFADFMTDAGFP